jgi:hypothetical protein
MSSSKNDSANITWTGSSDVVGVAKIRGLFRLAETDGGCTRQ